MQIKYKCCFCGKEYDWYQEVYVDKENDSGVCIQANSFVLKNFTPLPEKNGEKLEVDEVDGNLEGMVINLCRDCMHELLTKCHPTGSGKHNCFEV